MEKEIIKQTEQNETPDKQENRIYRGQSQPPTERTYQVTGRTMRNDRKRLSACAGI